MDALFILLELQKQASQAPDLKTFEFTAVNGTNKLVPYKQAVFWSKSDLGVSLSRVSGNATLDPEGSYGQWLKGFIKRNLDKRTDGLAVFSAKTIEGSERAEWAEYAGAHGALIAFQTPKEGLLGGLWLERDKAFSKPELSLLSEMAGLYAQIYALLKLRERSALLSPWKSFKKRQKIITAVFVALCLFPVRMTLTAPAEIVAQSPTVITVPYDGVLDEVSVKPGDEVLAEQLLFTMDKTDLEGKIESAGEALRSAQSNLSRLRRESLSAPEKKVELNALVSEIAARKIENDHAQKLLRKSDVKSPVAGIAIFSDANEFEGQPARTGNKVMVIADPAKAELLIKAPIDNMIPIDKDAHAEFFLNVMPLSGYDAQITSMGYQASPDPDGLLSYKIRADITENKDLRIGWKGTAKIRGSWTILGYSILRRPLIALRKITGI